MPPAPPVDTHVITDGPGDSEGRNAPARNRRRAEPQPFDFRRPSKFSREQIRALQIIHETFARQLATVLSTSLRIVCQVGLGSLEQRSYAEYTDALPNPTYIATFSAHPLPGGAMLAVPLELVMGMVDRLLGGPGDGPQPVRALTDIESVLVRDLFDRGIGELSYAFESLMRIDAKVVQQEFNPQFAQIAAPSDMTLVINLDIHIGNQQGAATLCLPYPTVQPILELLTGQSLFNDRAVADLEGSSRAVREQLLGSPVEVSVSFNPVVLTSSEILDLAVGDVIPLRHPVAVPLKAMVGSNPCLSVVPGRSGKRLACLVVDEQTETDR